MHNENLLNNIRTYIRMYEDRINVRIHMCKLFIQFQIPMELSSIIMPTWRDTWMLIVSVT